MPKDYGVIGNNEYNRVYDLVTRTELKLSESTPHTNELIDSIHTIFKIMQTPEMVQLKATDPTTFKSVLYDRLSSNSFIENNIFLVEQIINGDLDFDTLETLIKTRYLIEINQLKQETSDRFIMEFISRKYLYPTFGGKREFQRVMMNQNKKENNSN